MKFLLIAAFVAVAAAAPKQLVDVGSAGPAPAIPDGFLPVAIGPALIDEFQPVAIGPAMIENLPAAPATAPLVQIILNIKAPSSVNPIDIVASPEPVHIVDSAPAPEEADPVQVEDSAPEPIQVVDNAPLPVVIGNPELPVPVVVVPVDELN